MGVMITAVTVKIRVDMAIVTVVTVTNIMDTAKVMADTAMAMVDMVIAMADMVIAMADMVIAMADMVIITVDMAAIPMVMADMVMITADTEEVTAIQNIRAPVTVTKVIPRVTQQDLLPTVPKAMVDTNDNFNQTSLN